MIGSKYENTRVDLSFKIRKNFATISEEIQGGFCYLCKRKIKEGFLLEYKEEISETEFKFSVHKACYFLANNYNFYLDFLIGIN